MSGWAVVGIVAAVVAVLLVFPLLSWAMQRAKPSETGGGIGTALEGIDAIFNPGKQRELDQRQHEAEAPEEQPDGAPPRSKVDLTDGTAVIRLPPKEKPPV
jgi:hypothetical protein